MPPWGAVKGFGEFRNDQGLTAEQLELIGGRGSDTLLGRAGDDDLDARDGIIGNDSANGGAGSDRLRGDAGDLLIDRR